MSVLPPSPEHREPSEMAVTAGARALVTGATEEQRNNPHFMRMPRSIAVRVLRAALASGEVVAKEAP